jgi:hypothetical protein
MEHDEMARAEVTGKKPRVIADRARRRKRTKTTQRARFENLPPGAYSLSSFCVAHDLSESFYHKLRPLGLTPREMRLGARVFITYEAAAAWRAEREAATAAAGEAAE